MDHSFRINLILEWMEFAQHMGRRASKKYNKDEDEMIAEAYFILSYFILTTEILEVENLRAYLGRAIGRQLWQYSHNYACHGMTISKLTRKKREDELRRVYTNWKDEEDFNQEMVTEIQLNMIMDEILKTGIEKTVFKFWMLNWDDQQIAKELGRNKRLVRDVRSRIIQKVEKYVRTGDTTVFTTGD